VPTHYEVLGVGPSASAEEVRRAYVELARALHPDRAHGDARRMQEVNEAWRVLRDPTARRAYDASLAPPPPLEDVDPMDVPFHAPEAEPGDVGVAIARALPWVAILVVLALIFLVTAVANRSGRDESEDLVGRCVRLERASEVEVVPCTEANDGRVELVVDRPALCPDGSDGQGMADDRWLCLS
jgi:curved DNA-binding protein CbpA